MRLRLIAIVLGLLALFGMFWVMWPSPISPSYWREPPAPELEGPLQPNDALRDADIYAVGGSGAAEGLALTDDGRVMFGTPGGHIRILTPLDDGTGQVETLTYIGDTAVLGLNWIAPGMLGAATLSGLYAVDASNGQHTLISSGVPAHPFGYINDLAVSGDGTVYFTDSSTRWSHESPTRGYVLDMLENRPNGALYVWDPSGHQTRLVRDRLYFPNGVAVAADGQSIFVSETFRYRILRLWVAGPRRGEMSVLADNLPGFPEGLRLDDQGRLFVAMPSRRQPILTILHRSPFLARLIAKLPDWLRPGGGATEPFVLVLNANSGEPLAALHDPDGKTCYISNLDIDHIGDLWLGSSNCGHVARIRRPALPAAGPTEGQTSQPLFGPH